MKMNIRSGFKSQVSSRRFDLLITIWSNIGIKRSVPCSLFLGILLVGGCIIPESEWSDVTSDYESELNVFALISLDSDLPSFVQVHKTLGLEGPSWRFTGKDTVWYGDGPYDYWIEDKYESQYDVKNADVIISDGIMEYRFFHVSEPGSFWEEFEGMDEATYFDTLDQFHPVPNATYFLKVSTSSGLELTGNVTTPPIPHIQSEVVPDTINNTKTFTVKWDPLQGNKVSIETAPLRSWICGSRQWAVLDEGDSSWTSTVENCDNRWWGGDEPDSIIIKLRAVDENYYQYFIKHAFDAEFVNFFLGGGSSGISFGVEGGLGTFGAIASDRIYRVLVP